MARIARLPLALAITVGVSDLADAQGDGRTTAHGIDCSRARSPTEKAICASPSLLVLDHRIAVACADAQNAHANDPEGRAAMRADLLRWLPARDAACTQPEARIAGCLHAQMAARLAVLEPPAPPASSSSAAPSTPVLAIAGAARAAPHIPDGGPPQAAATLAPATISPTDRETDATLVVTTPGRFSIAARSRSGVALQFVDMLTGPDATVGVAGTQDGRLDLLLDRGTYRVRAFTAPGAADAATLGLTAFHDAAPPQAIPAPGSVFAADLADAQQRAFWLRVPPGGAVRLEAAGRSLADWRLWRDGRAMSALAPVASTIAPVAGHPLRDLLLQGKVEPGTYLAVAYGGPALAWGDGTAQPLLIRSGLSDALGQGLSAGQIGPFGSEVFAAPPFAGMFRLDVPQPAPVSLELDGSAASLTRTAREAHLTVSGVPGKIAAVTVRGAAGQPYTLRAAEPPGTASLTRPGRYWVSAITSGAGADEVPPTLLLERHDPADLSGSIPAPRIVGSALPLIAAGEPWRARFNLRGPTDLIVQNVAGGPVDVRTAGVTLRDGAGGDSGSRYDLPSGYFDLHLDPKTDTPGLVDVTLRAGAGGTAQEVPVTAPLPADPVIPFGVQSLAPGQSLALLSQGAPDSAAGLSARPVPVALADGPLFVTQAGGGAAIEVPVRIAPGGALAVRDLHGDPVAATTRPGPDGKTLIVTLPQAAGPRTVALSWQSPPPAPADIAPPPPPGAQAALRVDTPAPFDLAQNEVRSWALHVGESGLYRVETLGRLRTAALLSTDFNPGLAQDEAGGTGQNALIQHWLRAGEYRVAVAPVGSAGHGAVDVTPAPLLEGAGLVAGGRVHLRLQAGSGAAIPVVVTQAGTYRIDLLSEGATPRVRLDDPFGWPLTRPGPATQLTAQLQPGTDRLLIAPQPVAATVAVRLRALPAPVAITGHGPHDLPPGVMQHAVWREPSGSADPRIPDGWSFALTGPAQVHLDLSEGMVGTLHRPGADPTRFEGAWSGGLPSGGYRLDVASLGRNDRLEYRVTLRTDELQPGETRMVTLPATLPFSLASPRVVNLSSWGRIPVKAVLRDADGTPIARVAGQPDDWNLSLSRRLPAGRYLLRLAAAAPEAGTQPVPQDTGLPPRPADDSADQNGDQDGNGSGSADNADNDETAPVADAQVQQTPPVAPAADDADDSGANDGTAPAAPTIAVRLDLPASMEQAAASAISAVLPGRGVHVLTVPSPGQGALLVADAASAGSTVLSLERRDGTGWRSVALAAGPAPRVAVAGDGGPAPWRLEAWGTDGGDAPIRLAARVLDMQAARDAKLVGLDGMAAPLAAAHLRLQDPTLLRAARAPAGLMAATLAGGAAVAVGDGGAIAPQADALWLLADTAGPITLVPMAAAGGPVSIAVPAGGVVHLPAVAAEPGHAGVWVVASGVGQPSLLADGAPGAVAAGSAVATDAGAVLLRNGAGQGGLLAQARHLDLVLAAPAWMAVMQGRGRFTTEIPPRTALPVRLSDTATRLTAVLPPGTALLSAPGGPAAWAATATLARDFDAASGTLTLINAGSLPAPVTLDATAAPVMPAASLRPGMALRRFFGAAGSFDVSVAGAPDASITVSGAADLQWTGADGTVLRGRRLTTGTADGRLTVTHAPGALVVAMATPAVSPWPNPSPAPAPADGTAALTGAAMAWQVRADAASVLDVSTTAPVLLSLDGAPPELFAAGAELHRAIPAGTAILRAFAPQDGPLTGSLTLGTTTLRPLGPGLGPVVAVPPGGVAAFSFTLARPTRIGVGLRSDPDRAELRLLRADGTVVGTGVAQLRNLAAGTYLLEARLPPGAPAALMRPALLGLDRPGTLPPAEVIARYLQLAGLKEPTP